LIPDARVQRRSIRIQRLAAAGRFTGLAGRRVSASSPAQDFGPGAQAGRRFGQMGQAGIVPAQKRGFGPNFFDIFPKNYEISIGLHSDGPNELMG